mmetsp:Transcript_57417/g.134652  ORF Transcript_57417/g.134652 Transcript_57417/m.134652 type:complete len:940 (+) Transcript_57417:21-2840(+)
MSIADLACSLLILPTLGVGSMQVAGRAGARKHIADGTSSHGGNKLSQIGKKVKEAKEREKQKGEKSESTGTSWGFSLFGSGMSKATEEPVLAPVSERSAPTPVSEKSGHSLGGSVVARAPNSGRKLTPVTASNAKDTVPDEPQKVTASQRPHHPMPSLRHLRAGTSSLVLGGREGSPSRPAASPEEEQDDVRAAGVAESTNQRTAEAPAESAYRRSVAYAASRRSYAADYPVYVENTGAFPERFEVINLDGDDADDDIGIALTSPSIAQRENSHLSAYEIADRIGEVTKEVVAPHIADAVTKVMQQTSGPMRRMMDEALAPLHQDIRTLMLAVDARKHVNKRHTPRNDRSPQAQSDAEAPLVPSGGISPNSRHTIVMLQPEDVTPGSNNPSPAFEVVRNYHNLIDKEPTEQAMMNLRHRWSEDAEEAAKREAKEKNKADYQQILEERYKCYENEFYHAGAGGTRWASVYNDDENVSPDQLNLELVHIREAMSYVAANGAMPTSSRRCTEEPPRTGFFAHLLNSRKFERITALVILSNVVFIGFSADYAVKHPDSQSNAIFDICKYTWVFFYTIELILKLAVHGFFFFTNDQWSWNWLDFFLVVISFYDIIAEYLASGGGVSLTFLRVLRLMRVSKIFRAFRVMREFKELRLMLSCLFASLTTLVWCVLCLVLFMYIFAVVFCNAAAEYLGSDPPAADADMVRDNWGSILEAMFTLYKIATNGVPWDEVSTSVRVTGNIYFAILLFYVAFMFVALLNILTGMFVQKAFSSEDSSDNADLRAIQVLEQEQLLISDFRLLYHVLCGNGPHKRIDPKEFLSRDEFVNAIFSSPAMRVQLQSLGLEVWDAGKFHDMLIWISGQPEGKLTEKAFVQGCMELQGGGHRINVAHLLSLISDVQGDLAMIKGRLPLRTLPGVERVSQASSRGGKWRPSMLDPPPFAEV